MAYQLFRLPRQVPISSNASLLIGAKAHFFATETETPQNVYSDAILETELPNPVEADSAGTFPTIYLDPSKVYRLTLTDADDVEIYTEDPVNDSIITQENISQILWPRTDDENAVDVIPESFAYENDFKRYGAVGNNVADDTESVRDGFKTGFFLRASGVNYKLTGKVQTVRAPTVTGAGRGNAIFKSAGFADYVLEIGDGDTAPQAGNISNLGFQGASGNTGVIHFNEDCHLWRLDTLLFYQSPCPALIVDSCWDSFYTNIDIISCVGAGSDPETGASIIILGDANNIYFRGLRVEQGLCGALYCEGVAVYLNGGKIDNGFAASQVAAAITITANGKLYIDDFELVGVSGQYVIDTVGSLIFGTGGIGGGTNKNAAIYDHRAWAQSGSVATIIGPSIPRIDLGTVQFSRTYPTLSATTPAAVYSRIYPIRATGKVTVTADSGATGDTRGCFIDLAMASNDLYNGMYLVHNADGYRPGSRRKILSSLSTGQLTVVGSEAITVDGDYSIEFCGQHATPIQADRIVLESGQTLFAVVDSGCTIATLAYVSSAGATYGLTTFAISGISGGTDITGLYLVDETTGEPFYIAFGVDGSGNVGVMYDVTGKLNTNHSYSIIAGYHAGVNIEGSAYVWEFAGRHQRMPIASAHADGFDINNVPLWEGYSGSILEGSAIYDPTSLADGAGATTTVTVTGAALGDYVEAVSFSLDLQGMTLSGYVSAANTVAVRFQNESGGSLDLGSGTIRVRVRKQ